MFSFFKSKKNQSARIVDPGPAAVNRMSLDERKAFRQEMLYQSIRESFLSMEVIASMYKFKVMPVDARHHRFIAMIDVAKSFTTDKISRTKSFSAIEKQMRVNTYNRFGILITGIYWRVSETESQFESQPRASDMTRAGAEAASSAAMRARKDPAAELSEHTSRTAKLAREAFQPVSEEEAEAFMEALRTGVAPPVVHVGNQEYQSDLAPLDGGIMIGGTQYGRLE
ncbi:MAG: hypothetical protein RIR09_484 [Pseudomonadota bacterium]|jgi:hypothetical protein